MMEEQKLQKFSSTQATFKLMHVLWRTIQFELKMLSSNN